MDIIITAGPSINDKALLSSCIRNGANILRLNFSHKNIDFFDDVIKSARFYKRDIKIMQDLPGGKIRVSSIYQKPVKVFKNQKVLFTSEDNLSYKDKEIRVIPLNITKNEIIENSKNIESISIKDGSIRFNIIDIVSDGILTESLDDGIIRKGKGCNIKWFIRKKSELSKRERDDIEWACKKKVDIICQSFVENREDVDKIKRHISGSGIKVWAKVETLQGVNNIIEILDIADGIIIGRGDLIPETSLFMTPIFQDKIIEGAKLKNKKIVIATHIIDSMIKGRMPTLTEVESIYNHINKGVDGFLLASETSIGKLPHRTVKLLNSIINMYKKNKSGDNNI